MHSAVSSLPPTTRIPVSLVVPLANAHAHSDCLHRRPLLDALDHGFTSVEADVHLVGDRLLVAHDAEDVREWATLEHVYLDPLARRAREHGGTIYPGHAGTLQLLVDIKTDPVATYLRLHEVLGRFQDVVTQFVRTRSGYRVREAAVTAVVSGHRPRSLIRRQHVRYAAYDGRLSELGSDEHLRVMPLVSDDWTRHFTWNGSGPIPRDERRRLRHLVDAVHQEGRLVRFWGTPDPPGIAGTNVCAELLDAGVDYLNADDLPGLRDVLLTDADVRRAS
jgi:hypothetical protein